MIGDTNLESKESLSPQSDQSNDPQLSNPSPYSNSGSISTDSSLYSSSPELEESFLVKVKNFLKELDNNDDNLKPLLNNFTRASISIEMILEDKPDSLSKFYQLLNDGSDQDFYSYLHGLKVKEGAGFKEEFFLNSCLLRTFIKADNIEDFKSISNLGIVGQNISRILSSNPDQDKKPQLQALHHSLGVANLDDKIITISNSSITARKLLLQCVEASQIGNSLDFKALQNQLKLFTADKYKVGYQESKEPRLRPRTGLSPRREAVSQSHPEDNEVAAVFENESKVDIVTKSKTEQHPSPYTLYTSNLTTPNSSAGSTQAEAVSQGPPKRQKLSTTL